MTPNERVEPADPIADGLRRCRVAEANVLPVVGYTTTEVNIGQYRYARFRQQTLAEDFRVGAAGHAARLGDVGPRIERTTGSFATHTRHRVQELHDQIAARQKTRAHRL